MLTRKKPLCLSVSPSFLSYVFPDLDNTGVIFTRRLMTIYISSRLSDCPHAGRVKGDRVNAGSGGAGTPGQRTGPPHWPDMTSTLRPGSGGATDLKITG